jgi:hypothetical protein
LSVLSPQQQQYSVPQNLSLDDNNNKQVGGSGNSCRFSKPMPTKISVFHTDRQTINSEEQPEENVACSPPRLSNAMEIITGKKNVKPKFNALALLQKQMVIQKNQNMKGNSTPIKPLAISPCAESVELTIPVATSTPSSHNMVPQSPLQSGLDNNNNSKAVIASPRVSSLGNDLGRKDIRKDEKKDSAKDNEKKGIKEKDLIKEKDVLKKDLGKDNEKKDKKDSEKNDKKDSEKSDKKDSEKNDKKDSEKNEKKNSGKDEKKDYSREKDLIKKDILRNKDIEGGGEEEKKGEERKRPVSLQIEPIMQPPVINLPLSPQGGVKSYQHSYFHSQREGLNKNDNNDGGDGERFHRTSLNTADGSDKSRGLTSLTNQVNIKEGSEKWGSVLNVNLENNINNEYEMVGSNGEIIMSKNQKKIRKNKKKKKKYI